MIDSLLSIKYCNKEKQGADCQMEVDPPPSTFADAWISRMHNDACKPSYIFLANLLSEIVCPDVIPTLPWPDEELLKYTIERYQEL